MCIDFSSKSCHLLSLLLEELDQEVAALHSFKSQSLRLAALHRFKSGQVVVLLATDVASRRLDIPTVDLVVNYDIPRYTRDYTYRVGHTARASKGGLAVSFVTEMCSQLYMSLAGQASTWIFGIFPMTKKLSYR
ncbi:hypothetical protein RGQ29_021453 [Quercus rubra]|uniref:Helicase C-terminal domain-containing protein n=1 Tax=Quercus rubra TaxID=3512 RepID=A0AAN7IRD7_QUERU|nr:hypothetical protein RGQ29_021453 [Quercus rubra]